ncbi:MAG TPA: BCAM0308 family protein [Nitrospira sp.]|nr:BCAM0308 family protein [Nitrospira sp.]
MSTSHLPRDKKDRSVQRHKHDPYRAKGKLRGPSVCGQCKAVYQHGRWTWGHAQSDSHTLLCPACEGIRDDAPSGILLIAGEFVAAHREEVVALARHEEARVKAEHPLARIMKIKDQTEAPQGLMITTTDPHLARRIGETLHHAHRGTFTCRYEEKEDLLRANWET